MRGGAVSVRLIYTMDHFAVESGTSQWVSLSSNIC